MKPFVTTLLCVASLSSTAVAGSSKNCPSHLLKANTVFGHKWFINIHEDDFEVTTSNGTVIAGVLVQFDCSARGTFGFHATRTDGVQHGCNGKFSGKKVTNSICTGGEHIATGSFQ